MHVLYMASPVQLKVPLLARLHLQWTILCIVYMMMRQVPLVWLKWYRCKPDVNILPQLLSGMRIRAPHAQHAMACRKGCVTSALLLSTRS